MAVIDPDALMAAVKHIKTSLATALKAEFETVYTTNHDSTPSTGVGPDAGKNSQKNLQKSSFLHICCMKGLELTPVRKFM